MAGIRRIQALSGSIFGLRISEGTIVRAVEDCGKRLIGPIEAIKVAVLRGEVVHLDETGMRNRGML
jgi:hypothetical protein